MARGSLLLFAFALLIATSVSANAARTAGTPKYLTAGNAEFSLNSSWKGSIKIAGVDQQGVTPAPNDPGETIWSPACSVGPQSVVFRRNVELLGPAQSGTLRWWYTTGSAKPWPGLTTFEAWANGERIGRWAGATAPNTFTVPPAVLKHLRNGTNQFEIRATRAPLPAGSTRCNVRGQKPSIALTGMFTFGFATDLRPGVPAEKVSVRHGTSLVIKQFVRNQGKARALAGALEVYYGGQGTAEALINSGAPVFCTKQSNTTFSCPFENLDPGEQMEILVRVTYTPTPDYPKWDHINGSVGFTVRGDVPDTNRANDASQTGFILCQEGSTLAECKT